MGVLCMLEREAQTRAVPRHGDTDLRMMISWERQAGAKLALWGGGRRSVSSPIPPGRPQGRQPQPSTREPAPAWLPPPSFCCQAQACPHQPVRSLLTLVLSCFFNLPAVYLFQAGLARQW